MTSRDILSESVSDMSFYEDALDLSDEDLKQLCKDTERHLRLTRESQERYANNRYRRAFTSTESIPEASSSPKPIQQNQSSSSGDNSSIERISSGPQTRSRQSTGQPRRRGVRSDGSSNGNNDGWKMVNPMDYSCYPMLFQIDKQLQLISMQLRETQLSNSLQLRLMYRMIKIFISPKKRSWSNSGVPFSLWIWMFLWPVAVQVAYYFYKKHRHQLMLTFMDIM
ncbi:hypothetical protein M3Y94_00932000 [Aphelenchoides besseyi]|nr:hypothetical protein M3Y94_00932000 [Aphelenchoides besseyi]KAI6224981.1 hypothetical protein M3Y95_00810000 [Aphelenchoides besseyi]